MTENVENRRWSVVPIVLAALFVVGVSALVAALASDQGLGLGLLTLGGAAIVLMALTAVVPAARRYFYSEAEQRVLAGDAPVLFLMLVVVWMVPGLLAYVEVVPERAAFSLALAAFWLLGVPVLGWHHARVLAARRRNHPAAESAQTGPASAVESIASEPRFAGRAKSLAVTLLGYWWSLIPGAIVGTLIVWSALEISGALKRRQLLEITNTGGRPVTVSKVTLGPGGKYLAWLPDDAPIVVEGSELATFDVKPRTADVAKTASGAIDFHFTDDPPAGSQAH